MAFLVIEGLDGSGKSTQIKLLREYLEKKGVICKYIHFPRTESGIFGDLISMFLRGELGKIDEVNPYLVSLIYAADRHDARTDMLNWLSEDRLLLADRYIMSNIAFQCAKLETSREKKELKEWILHLEYTHYGIPRPDMNIFLDVPFEFTREKLSKNRNGNERNYLRGSRDIHETDMNFQQKVRQVYIEQAETEDNFRLIHCYDDKKGMLKPMDIFGRIISLLKKENLIFIK
ncbi:MAG: dTMP kinase [Bacteroidales bacterium]